MPRFIPVLPTDRRYIPLVGILIVLLTVIVMVFFVVNTAVKVDGDSMLPGLHSGDHVLVTRGYRSPMRGDIVSLSIMIEGEPDSLIKRVIGIPGDTVEIFGDRVTVNGAPEPTWYETAMGAEAFHLGPLVVPEGTVYVLGDNREISMDSRFFGAVKLSHVRGRAIYLFSPISRMRRIDATAGRP